MYKLFVLLALVAVGCTRPNPNRCCTDEADCNEHGIAVGSTCDTGLVCRGNQCISEPCTEVSDCEASAPYCVAELCAEACSDDLQCPGFGQSASNRYCVDGGCHECRGSMNDDCPANAPVCDQSGCRLCREHDECKSGVCANDGTCADEASIAYVEIAGSASADCTRSSPCKTISRALTFLRPYVLIGAGTYASDTTLTPPGHVRLIGSGMPALTRSTPGPIVTAIGGNVALEQLEVSGATINASSDGYGVSCQAGGSAALRLHRVVVRNNAGSGVFTNGCPVTITESTFSENGRETGASALELDNSIAIVDRCLIINNASGLNLDAGVLQLTNSFIVRNDSTIAASYGLNIYSVAGGHRIEFNTIADNGNGSPLGAGFMCNLDTVTASVANNIIVRNKVQIKGTSNCTYPSSIILDTDISAVKFRSPDVAPYDYHLTAGSLAIDGATLSTVDHDFDGQPRTTPRDVGADEYVP